MGVKRKIFVVEDHPVFRVGLRELLDQEPDLRVCGEAEDVGTALAEITRHQPDLVIVDLSLKGRSGMELIREIRANLRDTPVLVLSMYDEALYAERALAAGARGYIMKQEASESIVAAVRRVLEGKIYLSAAITDELLGKLVAGPRPTDDEPHGRLTDREVEVLQWIGLGLTTSEIGEKLSLSVKTVGTYRERLKEKLHLRSSAELVCYAVRWAESQQR